MTDRIPGPYAWPVIGNMLDVRSVEGISKALDDLADIYGPIFQITLKGQRFVVVGSAELLKQMTDEKCFIKLPPPALESGSGAPGLFTARSDDPDWFQAHRILSPAFGVLPIQDMFTEMKDIATQLCLKWARKGPENKILLTDDFTRLTLDTIALCAMDYRFNSFYSDEMHPFVDAMLQFLKSSGERATSPWIYRFLTGQSAEASIEISDQIMISTAQMIIDERRNNPSPRHDLLNTLLYGKDPQSGEMMRDKLIVNNMNTFLIAGHETTSGLLSFAFMQLLRHPDAYLKAQREIDEVIGAASIEAKHLNKLPFLNAVLRETLRLNPTAPSIAKTIHPSRQNDPVTVCEGKYLIEPNVPIKLLLSKCMSDPTYFGDDARDFVPERMLETNPKFAHYLEAWKPFGNGSRSCIGQNFAWQEALLVMAMVLQNFDVNLADERYQPRVVQALTVKPKDLFVKVKLRRGNSVTSLNQQLYAGHDCKGSPHTNGERPLQETEKSSNINLVILYGSNTGTCRSLAQRLGSSAASRFGSHTLVSSLDEATDKELLSGVVVIVTASYEGQPPENAGRFVAWLKSCKDGDLDGIKFSVFGCGHRDWHKTLYAIPKFIDKTMEARGAKRVYDLGTSDVSQGNVTDDFSAWQTALFERVFGQQGEPDSMLNASEIAEVIGSQRVRHLDSPLTVAKVSAARLLTMEGAPEKRELTVDLPGDLTYSCGDYLGILPVNPDQLVKRMMAHWNLPWDAVIILKSKMYGNLPLQQPLSIFELLKNEFEVQQPAAQSDVNALLRHAKSPRTNVELKKILAGRSVKQGCHGPSLFDYLVKFPDISMQLSEYLTHLFPLRIRQYSIASSPMVQPNSCTIVYSVVHSDFPKPFMGVATTFLSGLCPGDNIQISLKETATAKNPCPFRLPSDHNTPLLMYCAGTGLAPFRGFLQQRAFMLETDPSIKLAPALLFVGCRSSTADRLYADELDKWSKAGIVDVKYAFSQEPKKSHGCKHISDRMGWDKDDIVRLWDAGAKAFICGSRRVQESVQQSAHEILEDSIKDDSEEERERKRMLFREATQTRVVSDIFD